MLLGPSLISTGLPFYNIEGDRYFPGNCTEEMQPCYNIPNSIAININLGMNNGEILIEDYTTMDYLNYNEEAYWPVGAPFIGHSVELIEPYKNRNLSSNFIDKTEVYKSNRFARHSDEKVGGINNSRFDKSEQNNFYQSNFFILPLG